MMGDLAGAQVASGVTGVLRGEIGNEKRQQNKAYMFQDASVWST